MSKTMEIVIKAIDQASNTLKGIQNTSTSTTKTMKMNYAKLGIGIAAAGTAMHAFAKSQAPLTEQTKQLAASTNMTTKEMRNLAIATSDVTFPLNEVLDIFETGRQQGIRSGEQLQEYAQFWDLVGDATQENATHLASAGVALNAIGIEATNQQEALSAFGFITQETTSNVGEFLQFIERTGPELRQMGMDIDDSAAILGLLEKEFGMTGRTARQEFRSAVNQSNGDMNVLMQTLGISQQQFNNYRNEVEASSDVIQRNADIHAESYTLFDKFRHRVSELTYQYGDQISVLGDLGSVMMGAGTMITTLTGLHGGLATAKTIGAAAATKFGIAMNFALGPVGLVILAITAAIAIGIALYKNWDKVVAGLRKMWEGFANFFKSLFQAMWKPVQWYIDTVRNNFQMTVDFLRGLFEGLRDAFVAIFKGLGNIIKAPINFAISGINKMISAANRINIQIPNWVPAIGGRSFGINLPKIPQLAEGGYVKNRPGGILANIGEGDEPEIVSPESKMREIVRKESGSKGVMNLYLQINGKTLAQIFGVEIRDEVIARLGGA